MTLLRAISEAWSNRRGELENSAEELLAHVRAGAEAAVGRGSVGPEILETAARALHGQFDARYGGFGGAPKFPPAMRLEFLIRYFLRSGEPSARRMVETTLAKMAAGGMYEVAMDSGGHIDRGEAREQVGADRQVAAAAVEIEKCAGPAIARQR